MKSSLSIFLLLVFGAGSAQAASFDCVAPVFPNHSTSKEGVRRIEKQVRQWRACNSSRRPAVETVEVDRLNAEVDASLAKWIAATRAYSNANGRHALIQMEREKVDYGTWMRGSSQSSAVTGAGKM